MSSTPQYQFDLFTSKYIVNGFSNAWGGIGFVGPSFAPWVYDGVTNSWVATGGASIAQTDILRSPIFSIPTDGIIEIFLEVRTQYNEMVEVSLNNGGGADFEVFSQGLTTQFCEGGVTTVRSKILRARMQMFANANQYIAIRTRARAAGNANIRVTSIALVHLAGETRSIQPGDFKSLNFNLDRSPNYWGAVPSLAGSIQLVGADYRWLQNILFQHPALNVFFKLRVTANGFTKEFSPVLLDTTSMTAIGENGKSYSATLPLLKDSEWTKLVSHANSRINISVPYDVDGIPTVDGAPIDVRAAGPSATAKKIILERIFDGRAAPTTAISIPGDAIYFVGFGNEIIRNDDFAFSTGVGTQETIQTQRGTYTQIVGSVTLFFNSNGMPVQVMVDNLLGWTNITSGVALPINITIPPWYTQNFSIRVWNTTGAAKNFTVTGSISTNIFKVTTKVQYNYFAIGYRPLLALKHYLARVVGDYDNLEAVVFNNNWPAIGSANPSPSGGPRPISANQILNPPPKNLTDYGGSTSGLPTGNYYTGGVNWIYNSVTPRYEIINRASDSNGLLIRLAIASNSYTTYLPITIAVTHTISVNLISFTNVSVLQIYGHRLARKDLLGTVPLVLGLQNVLIATTRYYDGVSLVAVRVPATSMSIAVGAFLINSGTPAPPLNGGEYAKTFVCSGSNLASANEATAITTNSYPLQVDLQTVLRSLSNIFGLGMRPLVDITTGFVKVVIEKIVDLFSPAVSALTFEAQSFEYSPDDELIYDSVSIGGEYSEEFNYYGDAASTESSYTNNYLSAKRPKNLTFPAYLNSAAILNGGTGEGDIIILDLQSLVNVPDIANGSQTANYRLDENLTITGSPSPLQLNWLHSEGRLMRKNSTIIFAGGSEVYRLMYSKRSSSVVVNFSGDALGGIADDFPIFGASAFKPFLLNLTTDFILSDINTLEADIHKKFTINFGVTTSQVYIKGASYNFASGKLILSAWLTTNVPI